jgi:hypothetical protein
MNAFQPGEYWIGDLCYVMHDEWQEVCKIMWGDLNAPLETKLNDGRKFGMAYTLYGDGVYLDNYGNDYGVDAGLIGVIKVSDISERDRPNIKLGHVHKFDTEFQLSRDDLGMITIGHVEIFTGDYVEDVEEYDPED